MQYSHQIDRESGQQLPLEVDGLPLHGGAPDAYTVQAVIGSFSAAEREQVDRLRDRIGPEIGVVDSHFDDVPHLLRRLGFRPRPIAGEDLAETALPVVAIGCPHRHTRLDRVDVDRFLQRGGVLLSSDRAIRLPGISAFLGHLPGRPLTRARLVRAHRNEHDAIAPVWLDAGHLPIDPATLDASDAQALATNPLTGEPLVVVVRSGAGALIHSVPHWLQQPQPDALTSVERRPLRAVPQFRHTGNSYPDLTLGGFLAQRSLVEVLVESLAMIICASAPADSADIERGK